MLLCAAVDQMTYTATHLRHIMGLPAREHSGIEESGSSGLDEPRPPSQPTSPGVCIYVCAYGMCDLSVGNSSCGRKEGKKRRKTKGRHKGEGLCV